MKADVGPDRVSPLSNSRSYSSKRCATHSSQREDDRLRDLKILCASCAPLAAGARRIKGIVQRKYKLGCALLRQKRGREFKEGTNFRRRRSVEGRKMTASR